MPNCGRLLDFGCGRGREIFLERARETAGLDGSLTFLRDCAQHYTTVALGRLPRLPFRSLYFDVVVSSHTIGHVALDEKDTLISEISRVLKPGGVTAHIIETDSDHPAVQAAKNRPGVYRKQFIEQHGHIGLEPAPQILERFMRHGFDLKTMFLVDALLPSVMNFRTFFHVPELSSLPEVRWSRRLSRWTATNCVINVAYEIVSGAIHQTLEKHLADPNRAQFIMVSFEKCK